MCMAVYPRQHLSSSYLFCCKMMLATIHSNVKHQLSCPMKTKLLNPKMCVEIRENAQEEEGRKRGFKILFFRL